MSDKYILRYQLPAPLDADGWRTKSLPIGNGYSGANIFGGIAWDRLQLSEESLWTGGPIDETVTPVHGSYIGNISRAIGITGRGEDDSAKDTPLTPDVYLKAQAASLGKIGTTLKDGPPDAYGIGSTTGILKKLLPTNKDGLGRFQNFAEINMEFMDRGERLNPSLAQQYTRELNLHTGVATVKYDYLGMHHQRTYFASYPQRVMVMKFESTGNDLSFIFNPTIPHRYPSSAVADGERHNYGKIGTVTADSQGSLKLSGHLLQNGLKFYAHFKLVPTDGQMSVVNIDGNDALSITSARSVLVIVSYGTNYDSSFHHHYRTTADFEQIIDLRLNEALAMGYDEVMASHLADYCPLFSAVDFHLDEEVVFTPTDELLDQYQSDAGLLCQKKRRFLEVLYFHYGRYLLIASSRKGSFPANLQGVWNMYETPPWQSDYHLNINLQMNYWLANHTNLKDCLLPLLDYIDRLRVPGRLTARAVYGVGVDAPLDEPTGWVAHVSSNIFGYTGLVNPHNMDESNTGHAHYSPESAAWMMQNVYNLYQYYPDEGLLREQIYPLLKETVAFYTHENILVTCPVSGRLVMAPSYSSEHGPMWAGATFQQQLLWQLFTDTVEAAGILGVDEDFCLDLLALRARLSDGGTDGPVPIGELSGSTGEIGIGNTTGVKEWWWETAYYQVAPYATASSSPAHQADAREGIIPNTETEHRHLSHLVGLYPGNLITEENPEWLLAAVHSLNIRGDAATGWSRGKKMNLWARTGDGNRAYRIFNGLLTDATYDNLWDFHTGSPSEGTTNAGIFQIDGNLGGSAGMAEMLLQSHAGYLKPLPALPDVWHTGAVRGLTARGGFQVSMKWEKMVLTFLEIYSTHGLDCCVKLPGEQELIRFKTTAGESYRLI